MVHIIEFIELFLGNVFDCCRLDIRTFRRYNENKYLKNLRHQQAIDYYLEAILRRSKKWNLYGKNNQPAKLWTSV